ncbi:MAG TPA: hypothetical protein ENI23_01405, partial [bacterium]|nr:hypothetical protein [bacterium]
MVVFMASVAAATICFVSNKCPLALMSIITPGANSLCKCIVIVPAGAAFVSTVFSGIVTPDSGIKGHDDAEAALGYQKPKSGNIEFLDEYKERVDQGIVKYVGSGVTREKNGFGIGDMVIFSGYSGELVSIEGEGLFIILPARFVVAQIITEPTQIDGLFFQDTEGNYWPATYESAIEIIAKALAETSVLK